jgi:DNA modification methylase
MKGGEGVYCFRETGYKSNEPRFHPTQKPIALIRWCVTKTEGVILDPYMGSGTTLVAAKTFGRPAIGIEIEERYCEVAVRRLAQGVLPL